MYILGIYENPAGETLTVTISRWGNSLAVRLPKDVLDEADIHEGDRLEVNAEGSTIRLTRRNAPASLDELIGRITPQNLHSVVFDTPVGAELW